MNIAQIEENVQNLLKTCNQANFIFDLLGAYGKPKASIKRLQTTGTGSYNLAKSEHEVLWKKNLYFKAVPDDSIHSIIDNIRRDEAIAKHEPRFLTVTNFSTLLAVDTRTGETLDIPFVELGKNFDFFLPWAGLEKARYAPENPADVKAAEKMAKLFDLLRQDNPTNDPKSVHALNVFLSRLLFCYFAEDTEIFPKGLFTSKIASHTAEDGSDLATYLDKLFDVLNTQDRGTYPPYLQSFPYVNGGLFADKYKTPNFSRKSRAMLIECGSDLNWSQINPDIFGSMIQAVVHPDQRGNMGMHYTSVTNIMKVIEPLFLNDLYEEFRRSEDSQKKLEALLRRIEKIKIFDPACGSGNFLIIAYKELRKLEMEIFNRLKIVSPQMGLALSGIQLCQFHGIELDDFAHEVAILSLWLAEHQMNVAFKSKFGSANPSLPLRQGGKIVCGNAIHMDWKLTCPALSEDEVYIIGNPPYLGFAQQSPEQKQDLLHVWGEPVKLDYISCWFLKAANYAASKNVSYAFVSTNSICQGEQVALLWPTIFAKGLEIQFCHTSFKWTNSAKGQAGVICVIVGVSSKNKKKWIFSNGTARDVASISPYLISAKNIVVEKRSVPLSKLPPMTLGDMAKDGGFLFLDREEKDALISSHPDAYKFVRRLIGSDEFINGKDRWCIWIEEQDWQAAAKIPFISDRLAKVAESRLASPKKATQEFSAKPYRFVEIRHKQVPKILVPTVSSERRNYIPIGFFNEQDIINAPNNAIYSSEPYIFAILHSRMHMTWVRAVSGRLKSDYRYSVSLCYNTFPIPALSEDKKRDLSEKVFSILSVRERYTERTIAELYDPDKMPADLRKVHEDLDMAVEHCYRIKPFTSEEERLEHLFHLYEEMTKG